MRGADLFHAVLDGANLGGTDLSAAILFGANLNGVHGRNVVFVKAYLKDLLMEGGELPEARFDGAFLFRAVLIGSTLVGSSMRQTTLTGTALEQTDLSGADLSGSLLNGASLDGARFSGARLKDARVINAVPDEADFTGAVEMPEHLRLGVDRGITCLDRISGRVSPYGR